MDPTHDLLAIDDERARRRMRRATLACLISMAVGALLQLVFVVQQAALVFTGMLPEAPWRAVVGSIVGLALCAVTLRLVIARFTRTPWASTPMVWGSFALAAAFLACFDVYVVVLMALGVWWGTLLLVARQRWLVTGFGAALIVAAVLRLVLLPNTDYVVLVLAVGGTTLWSLFILLGNWLCAWMWDVVREAIDGAAAKARLAVSEERLRFARDMHDLLGHSLSSMAVKSELAARLVTLDAERAEQEMRAVQGLARSSLHEVRTAVSGYRQMDVAQELENVRSVLGTVGVRCDFSGAEVDMPPPLRNLAAWIIREAGTNVLRHSRAHRCTIALRRDGDTVVVECYNDGVSTGGGATMRTGSGLKGLAERAGEVGGTLSALPTGDGGFLLRALLPAGGGPPRPAAAVQGGERP